jgi:cytoskeletal protein CcmA (bactofilin family)
MSKSLNGLKTIIGNGTTIIGDLHVEAGLRVEGIVKGTINASGELVVTDTGTIEGEISVGSAVVAGKIKGNLTAREKTVLEPGSVLNGDLRTKNLVITEGAYLNGNCAMDEKKE